MTRDQRAFRVSVWLFLTVCAAGCAFRWSEEALVPLLIVAAFAARQAVELIVPADPPPSPATEDFGQREHEQAVLDAAYRWRYAYVTPGSDMLAVAGDLAEAVDEWDVNRPHHENGGPIR